MRNPFASLPKVLTASEAGRLLRGKPESALDEYPSFVHDVGGVLRGNTMPPPLGGLVEFARGAIYRKELFMLFVCCPTYIGTVYVSLCGRSVCLPVELFMLFMFLLSVV